MVFKIVYQKTKLLRKNRIMTDHSTCKVLIKTIIILIKILAYLKQYISFLINTGHYVKKNGESLIKKGVRKS